MSPKKEPPRIIPTARVAQACLEVAKNDLAYLRKHPYQHISHKDDQFVATEIYDSINDRAVARADQRITFYEAILAGAEA